ncbi:uncharacterized protein EAF02_007068 [Botrytis sinoallii]|uniref:uncharacterized protein n=1 Tax=Botrytis sinoallii TaxID=1463999 RepID=UPI0018FF5CAA|nr:uncharacterized protein EAF02_007068 [Botrytis sinoallii]KAF7881177.1 hypothetical protein EAF02_007068 [Botrytis sinoallii]
MIKFRVGPSVESLQAVKPLKIEERKEIVDLRVLCIANTRKYAACFMGVRPFEGFGLPGDGLIVKSKRDSTTYHDANTGSNGIDIMLVVLRQHLSFHPELCVPQDQITDEETEVYKVAWMNLGENKIQDWDIKRKLFKSVHGIHELHFDDIMEKKFSFEDALAHPKRSLRHRKPHNATKYPDEPDPAWARAIAEPDSLHLFNELRWDGVKELDAFIDRHFKTVRYGNERRIFFAAKPWFFKVLYEPQMIMRSISELRNFEMGGIVTRELKVTGGLIIHNKEKHVYALCAVVRLGNGNDIQDDVRTYHPSGREVTPLGTPKEFVAKAEYKKLGKRWSIKDGGRYMLFYVRITPQPAPLPEDYFDEDAPEFEPRYSWDTSDVNVTDVNQQNRGALENTSSSTSQSSSNKGQLGFHSEPRKFAPSTNSRVPMFGPNSPMPMFGPRSSSELPQLGSTFQAPKFGSSTQASGSGSCSQESAINARNPPKMTPTPSSARTHSSRNSRKRGQDGLMHDDADHSENNDSHQSSKSGGRSSSRPRNGEYCNFCRKSGHDERDCYKKNPALSAARGASNGRGNHSQRRGRGSLGGRFGPLNEGVGSSTDQNRGDREPDSGGYGSNRNFNIGRDGWVWKFG